MDKLPWESSFVVELISGDEQMIKFLRFKLGNVSKRLRLSLTQEGKNYRLGIEVPYGMDSDSKSKITEILRPTNFKINLQP